MSRPSMFPMKLREEVRSSSNASRVRSLPLPSSSPTESNPTRRLSLPTMSRAATCPMMAHGHGQLLRLEAHDLALDGGLVADEHRGEPELAGCRDGALDHDGGTEVAAHGVHRDLHRPRLSGVEATRPRSR